MERAKFIQILTRRGVVLDAAQLNEIFSAPIRNLLTPADGNPKIAKGQKIKVLTTILHLAPSTASGFQTCPNATAGCAAACLNTAGRGGMSLDAAGLNTIQRARRRRTYWYFARRAEFMERLVREIESHEKRAARAGMVAAVRLNGTSDIPWEREPVARNGKTYANVMRAFPRIRFYDYTKRTDRGESGTDGRLPRNYHLTFSLAESNRADADAMLARGVSVAVVLRTPEIVKRAGTSQARKAPLPATFEGRRVIDGDETDVRFRDPRAVWVGLRAKGRAVKDASGFVHDAEVPA